MTTRLRLLAEQLRLSIVERQRLIESGIETLPDDDEEMHQSLATLQRGIAKLSGNGSSYLTDAQQDELADLRAEYKKLRVLLPQADADLHEPFYDDERSRRTPPSIPYKDEPEDLAARRSLLGTAATSLAARKSVRFSENSAEDRSGNDELLQRQSQVMAQQDLSLDVLSESISRQRELSIQIGDELDVQNGLLDEVDGMVDRSTNRLDSAARRLKSFTTSARENSRLTLIFLLILILFLLLVIL
jgi:syntaxin 8